ncbi:MAG TPA: hypothetical protein VF794_40200 [Archangium sp.]|jgi:hypothetical protein|uniref:hypothetical protein n=1 Tax=Archangium sp. TaxID=1872627 RepID=UPI002ED91409
MKPSDPIVPLEQERVDDLSGKTLALWERDAASTASAPALPWVPLDQQSPESWQALLRGATSLIVVCTSRRPPVVDEVVAWASQLEGIRTYVRGPTEWAASPVAQALLKRGGRGALVRLGAEPPGDWIVVDQGRTGWLWVGRPSGARGWAIPLAEPQARSLFEASVHLFWHHATREALPDENGMLRFGPCLPSPVPPPGGSQLPLACGVLEPGGASRGPLLANAEVVVEPGGEPIEGAPRLLVTPPSTEGFDRLSALATSGVDIVWFERQLPRLALTRNRMALALEEGAHRLRLEFAAPDAIRMLRVMEQCAAQGAWRFHPKRALRDVRGVVRLAASQEERRVHDEVPVNLGDVQAQELMSMEEVRPASWPEPGELSRRIRYQWRVVPPRAPTGARQAELCRQWEQLDDYVRDRVERLRARLEKLEREEADEGLLTRLANLVSQWGEVRSRRKRLRQTLDEIAEQPLSKRPEEAPGLVEKLSAQEDAVEALEKHCRTTIEEEERRLEEEAQRREYDLRIGEATAEREKLQSERAELLRALGEKRDALGALAEERRALGMEIARAEHDARVERAQSRLVELATELPQVDEQLAALEEKLRTAGDSANKDERKGWGRERHSLEEKRKRLRGEEARQRQAAEAVFVPEEVRFESLSDARLSELAAREKALRAEVASLDKRVPDIDARLEACGRALDTPFQFQPSPRRVQAPRKEGTPRPPPIPNEPLPEIGALLEHGGKRYLSVSSWPQVKRALAAAQRLRAQLVVSNEVQP